MIAVRVLVADDDEDHLFLARHALQSVDGAAVHVDTVKDGEEALAYLRGEPPYQDRVLPNIVFLDLRMPRRTGLEVAEVVKRDAELAHIPVVMLTSSDRPEDIDAAYRHGINSYVTKSGNIQLRDVAQYWTVDSRLPAAGGPDR